MRTIISELQKEENRFGSISVLLIVVAVLGGIAAGLNLDNVWMLSLVCGVTMITESLIIAVQPMKRIFLASVISIIVNVVGIVMGLV
jgi:hypothetical protein